MFNKLTSTSAFLLIAAAFIVALVVAPYITSALTV